VTRDALTGSILGQALGDALGFVVEARPAEEARQYVERFLRGGRAGERSHPEYPFGQYTDDTQLARELLRSFRECGRWDPATFAARLARLFHERLDVGAGPGTRGAAQRLIAGDAWHQSGTPAPYVGNGSAMRAGPIGLLLQDRTAMICAAREQSRVTHLDPRCAAGAVVLSRAVSLAARRGSVDVVAFVEDLAESAQEDDPALAGELRRLTDWVGLDPAAAARRLADAGLVPQHRGGWEGISACVTPTVFWSLYAFLRSPDDYWETICVAISPGGDTDTMAAMAGAISGARVGPAALPPALVRCLTDRGDWGATELATLAEQCAGILSGSPPT
jgi:ADP-ribosylglycohydrolase